MTRVSNEKIEWMEWKSLLIERNDFDSLASAQASTRLESTRLRLCWHQALSVCRKREKEEMEKERESESVREKRGKRGERGEERERREAYSVCYRWMVWEISFFLLLILAPFCLLSNLFSFLGTDLLAQQCPDEGKRKKGKGKKGSVAGLNLWRPWERERGGIYKKRSEI